MSTPYEEELEGLKKEEETLEKMRALVSPEHWPRVYAMLRRVRDRIRQLEKLQKEPPRTTAA